MIFIRTEKQKDSIAKFSYDTAKIILAITVISPIAKPEIFHFSLFGKMTYFGIALIVLGIIALAGIIYVQLDRKHLKTKGN